MAQWIVDTTGMAPTGGNDRREDSLVGASTDWGGNTSSSAHFGSAGLVCQPKFLT